MKFQSIEKKGERVEDENHKKSNHSSHLGTVFENIIKKILENDFFLMDESFNGMKGLEASKKDVVNVVKIILEFISS